MEIRLYLIYTYNNYTFYEMHVRSWNEIKMEIPIGQFDFEKIFHDSQCRREIFYSFELVSCEDDEGIYKRFLSEVKECTPLFYTLTWHNKRNVDCFVSLDNLQQLPKNTLLHLAARGITRHNIVRILDRVLELDIRNLFIIRGDGSANDGDFNYAIDLIKFITERYHKQFYIGVAGYPVNHPESPSKAADLYYLKEKIDAGGSFIITQILFDSKSFIDFVKDCKNYDIIVPIIPFVMPILSYESFMKMTKICSLTVPHYLYNDLETLKSDTEGIQKYGIHLTVKIINDIISSRCASIIHLCTLNKYMFPQNHEQLIYNGE